MEVEFINTEVMRRVAKTEGKDNAPDETTILNLRRTMEAHGLAGQIFT